jgi:hypothetical protein
MVFSYAKFIYCDVQLKGYYQARSMPNFWRSLTTWWICGLALNVSFGWSIGSVGLTPHGYPYDSMEHISCFIAYQDLHLGGVRLLG